MKLQGVGTGPGGGLDDLQRHLQGLVMVAAHFGNDERWHLRPDAAVADLETIHGGDPSIHA
ncbi:hypothetical protein D3C76_1821790 [compost metagenome]